uniref:Uncharacterized protein n=1 Tax=Neolamprologus brichardi TaxID=32507 RepID=A0A3Q4HF18_NEOBR
MLPQHLKQIRVLMLNDKQNLERTLFRLEQGKNRITDSIPAHFGMQTRAATSTNHSRWPPLPEPGSAGGFFLLKGSFSFPLSPKCCS